MYYNVLNIIVVKNFYYSSVLVNHANLSIFCRMMDLQAGSRSGRVILLWWESTTSWSSQQGEQTLIKRHKDHIICHLSSQTLAYVHHSTVLQGQRDPVVRAPHSWALLPDQCAGISAVDCSLQVSHLTACWHFLTIRHNKNTHDSLCASLQLHRPW